MPKQSIGQVSLVVRDYDEAITFYVGTSGFTLVEDTDIPDQNKRWGVLAPPGSTESRLLLARATSEEQSSRIENQTGGRVFLFLMTDNFWRDFRDQIILYPERPGIFIPPGASSAHKARSVTPTVRLVLVEDVEEHCI